MGWIGRVGKQLVNVAFFVNGSAVFVYFRVFELDGLIADRAQHDLLPGGGDVRILYQTRNAISNATCQILATGEPLMVFTEGS
jgi:hypothetical protein